jgi:phage head maturation protease
MDDTMICFDGQSVKALGNGKVAGYLVVFSTEDDPDLSGEYFTKSTDFDFEDGDKTTILYHHGLDAKIGKRSLGKGTLRHDDHGVWVEAQLNLRDDYEKSIYDLAEKGKLGWSSGTASHRTEREVTGKAVWIKSWPLSLDASLTPTPAEPRTRAIPIKSLQVEFQAQEPVVVEPGKPAGLTLVEETEQVTKSLGEFIVRMGSYALMKAIDKRKVSQKKISEMKGLRGLMDDAINLMEAPSNEDELKAMKLRLMKEKLAR